MTSTLQTATRPGSAGGTSGSPIPPPTNVRARRSRRPGLLALSLFLILGSMLAGLWLYQSSTSKVGVLVAAQDLQAGNQLSASDTRVQYITAETDFLQSLFTENQAKSVGFYAGDQELVVGRFIPAGSPLVREYLVPRERVIPPNKAIVGLRLEAGSYPSALRGGDTVALYAAPNDDDVQQARPLGEASVFRMRLDERDGDLTADLVVEADTQESIVQAHRNDELRITLIRSGS